LVRPNADLAHELDVRRQISRASDDGHSLLENESFVITCGQNAVLSLPESGEWIHLPLPEQNETSPELSKDHTASAPGILVSRWKPVPRLVQLSDLLAVIPAARQAGLVRLAAEVVCLELARPILRNSDVKRRLKTGMFGVFVSDDSGIVRMLNQNFCKLSGRTPEELIGRSRGLRVNIRTTNLRQMDWLT
jgi:PAS domain-containing protein